VDRHIADYRGVRLLAQKVSVQKLPALTGLSAAVVEQYTALVGQYEPDLIARFLGAGIEVSMAA
jgi:hypothetical protein